MKVHILMFLDGKSGELVAPVEIYHEAEEGLADLLADAKRLRAPGEYAGVCTVDLTEFVTDLKGQLSTIKKAKPPKVKHVAEGRGNYSTCLACGETKGPEAFAASRLPQCCDACYLEGVAE